MRRASTTDASAEESYSPEDEEYDSSSGKEPSSKSPIAPRASAWTVCFVFAGLITLSCMASRYFSVTCGVGSSPPCPGRPLVATSYNGTWLRRDIDDRPYYDLVVAVLVVGGDTPEALAEIDRVRRVYARYGDYVVPDGRGAPIAQRAQSFRYVFVVGAGALGAEVDVPDEGLLTGDFFYVDVPEGYRYLSHKTKALMGLSEHIR